MFKSSTKIFFVAAVAPLFGSPVAGDRNFKKGVSIHTTQSCYALESHTDSSWWYSWGPGTGFQRGFCSNSDQAVADARASGMDFVPMFWASVPSQPFDPETEANLEQASYLMTFNEPDREDQANLTPKDAAVLWPQIETIATQYDLEIVAPCTTSEGTWWYDQFIDECKNLHGNAGCQYEFTCMHMYYYPFPCADGVQSWACIGSGSSLAVETIETYHDNYGKPVWVTEFACPSWGGPGCDASMQQQLMEQIVTVMDETDKVFRYAWYTTFDRKWVHNSLNVHVWDREDNVVCPNKAWVGNFGTKAWDLKIEADCVKKADKKAACAAPLVLSMDKDSCFCAKDACNTPVETHGAMKTYREVGQRNSAALTALGEFYNTPFAEHGTGLLGFLVSALQKRWVLQKFSLGTLGVFFKGIF